MLDGKKILIIRLSAIGDTIHTLPMVWALKKTYPDCEIGWVVESKAKMFVENNPLIDKCFIINKKRDNFFKVMNQIQAENYDYALDSQQLLKSGIVLGLSGAKNKLTLSGGREFSWLFASKIIKAKHPLFDINYHVVKRNLELCEFLGCDVSEIEFPSPEISEEEKANINSLISDFSDSQKPLIAISPATTWINKHLPNSFWSEIIDFLDGRANIVLTGSIKDEKLINHIMESSKNKNAKNLAGKTDLLELKELFSKCKLIITPDSGSAHIAWVSKEPNIISLFCATSANRTAPFDDNKNGIQKYFSYQAEVECSPCMKKKCRNKQSRLICTQSFDIEEIKNRINSILV